VAALALPLAFAAPAAAQDTGTVTGTVTDATNGQPLTGVQMVVDGTNRGALTNEEGRYLITRVPLGAQTVRAVVIGYAQEQQQITVTAGQPSVADFSLTTTAVNLEAIVVSAATGREQRLREVGTKVGTIEVEDLNPAPITSVSDVLSGRTEGVVLQDVNGTTGTSQRIRIRGANSLSLSNEPLIFVDGVQINNNFAGFGVGGQETNRLNDINPNDIANIEIIKGPAASASYGTAAANGVILITTKRGRPGDSEWQFFAEYGQIDDITDYPSNFGSYQIVDANAPLFLDNGELNDDAAIWCTNFLVAEGFFGCSQIDGTVSFDTMEDPRTSFLSSGQRQRYGASVRGGTDRARYFLSAQFEDETGVIGFNTQERINLRANLDAQLNDITDVSISVGYADGILGLNNNDNSIFSPIINGLLGYPAFVAADDGGPASDNYGFGFTYDDLENLVVNQEVDRFTTSGTVRVRPTSWLTLNANLGLDLTAQHDFEDLQRGLLPIGGDFNVGYRQSQRANNALYTAIFSGTGTFQLSDDVVSNTTAGTQYTQQTFRNTYCYGAALVSGTNSCGSTTVRPDIDEDFFEVRTLGLYLQQELAWRDRVFLTAGIRADQDSNFGETIGFTYFPSAQLSWVLSEESFFPEVDWISTTRVRGAYGESGLTPGFRQAITFFSPVSVATPGGDAAGVTLGNTGTPDLKPERVKEWEFGADVGLFDDRLSLDFTYFNRRSENALISRPLAPSLGISTSIFQNLGAVRNSGTELSARLDVVQTDNFGLNLGFNNTTLSNELETLGEGISPIIFNRGLQRHEEGFALGGFWARPYTVNDDGDGLVTRAEIDVAGEAEYIGPALPTWQRSVFADVRIGEFLTISTLVEGRGGHYTGNDSEAFRCQNSWFAYGCGGYGDPNATVDEQARAIADTFLGTPYGFIEEADFWRWRELSVTFNVPESLGRSVPALDGLRVTLAGRNLALFTDYTGLDPETVEGGGNANFSQSEFNTQPPVRYFMLRFDYSF
jgi:TonB-linked SusC/RagA family outer membrane protein